MWRCCLIGSRTRTWSNLACVADDGKLYEVDLRVVTPGGGVYLVDRGVGDARGRSRALDVDDRRAQAADGRQPLPARRPKAKKLKSLLSPSRRCAARTSLKGPQGLPRTALIYPVRRPMGERISSPVSPS